MKNLHNIKITHDLSEVEFAKIWHHFRSGFREFTILTPKAGDAYWEDNIDLMEMIHISGYSEICIINHLDEYIFDFKLKKPTYILNNITIKREERE